jgi:decaprenylphospho-beta-D-ribofuranose 2-oxidase
MSEQAMVTERQTLLEGWGMRHHALAIVAYPTTVAEIQQMLTKAHRSRRTVAPRGAGFSYTDAALNHNEMVLDLSRMNRVLAWDAHTGIITVEPGVTIHDLWRIIIPDGWWPPVVPGTMGPTIGGCLSMNIHGKNAWRVGSIGEHVLSFDLLGPQGSITTVTPETDLFYAVIGGLGMLGIITRVILQMRRIVSGYLTTRLFATHHLAGMLECFAEHAPTADYLVGWIDGFSEDAALGRGLVTRADFETKPDPESLQVAVQDVSPTIAGVVPRSQMWRAMKPMTNDVGMHVANAVNLRRGAREHGVAHRVPHAQFHFFHDYMPNWKRAWLPGGLRQFQAFIPREQTLAVGKDLLARSLAADLPPYLCVFKQHRADPFLLRYQVDGFSLSLDYRVTPRKSSHIATLFAQMRDLVVQAGGTFYLAKDDTLDATTYQYTIGNDRIMHFLDLKRRYDPDSVLESDLFRRVFGV